MIKSKELTEGCMAKAKDDEMTFVLLARDPAAPSAIRHWCQERIRTGKNSRSDAKIVEALDCAEIMESQRRASKGGEA
jgi:hypothetical protein